MLQGTRYLILFISHIDLATVIDYAANDTNGQDKDSGENELELLVHLLSLVNDSFTYHILGIFPTNTDSQVVLMLLRKRRHIEGEIILVHEYVTKDPGIIRVDTIPEKWQITALILHLILKFGTLYEHQFFRKSELKRSLLALQVLRLIVEDDIKVHINTIADFFFYLGAWLEDSALSPPITTNILLNLLEKGIDLVRNCVEIHLRQIDVWISRVEGGHCTLSMFTWIVKADISKFYQIEFN